MKGVEHLAMEMMSLAAADGHGIFADFLGN